ncbi:Glycine/D-amino acid oxidase [Blastococcus sp. DSM 46786]|uniref:NAD(P)/FAD-dependent oxidoreductase n=1 Tax=Blastococcus sp. DSM 46786 TaxID=1798227 RepID=UPI0008B4A7C8|nr:FAD-dependent oxidoreductase [Blastococcus sp. DSM 46786]SEL41470.1 Glycine/D-amino acid oxidase [Blastococcus sp. DSM 46786]
MAEPALSALADAEPAVFWLDDRAAPPPAPALVADVDCELAVVGGGYTGLWTALRARERATLGDGGADDVVVLEAGRTGTQASGRNGGFCAASLTHGAANGYARWPGEMAVLDRLGEANLDGIEQAVHRYGIDCDFRRTGALDVATEPWQAEELAERARLPVTTDAPPPLLLDADAVRAELDSPTYLAGLWERHTTALVEPARLAWGLRAAAESHGVRLHEHTPVTAMGTEGGRVVLRTPFATVRAARVVLATNAFPSLLRRLRPYTVPVYDYVLVTEPLSAAQLATVGWRNRQGVGDSANRFHYYRLTRDNRVLWGGYDAVYHYGSRIEPRLDQRPETFARLARHFAETFPQLADVRFTHRWGGVIDTSTRFCAFYGRARGGRVGYALGFTGLGVGATRFAADVVLDLLSGADTERTRLSMVRRRPTPFPPEPLRSAGIALTQWSLARADRHGGRRNLWLRGLDRAGLGFDS